MSAPLSPSGHLRWRAEALWQQLDPLLPGLSVEVVARTASTNTDLLDRVRGDSPGSAAPRSRPMPLEGEATAARRHEDDPTAPPARRRRAGDLWPCLLVAEQQTRGRGRMGRDWHSSPGLSLTFSLALPYAPVAGWSGLSLAVGLALAEALEPEPLTPRLRLKWPNDLWLAGDAPGTGRKLGGILLETLSLPGSGPARGDAAARWLVVGVGLNVRPQPAALVAEMAHGSACVQDLRPGIEAPEVLHLVAAPLVQALLRFAQQGFAPLRPAYARRDLLAGQPVQTTSPDCPQGVVEGVDTDGALCLQAPGPEGVIQRHRVLSGEVSVRTLVGVG
jgi:BirA family biotin operon repressor/biotin-[acetyl-CoA-carboxylase] ligase